MDVILKTYFKILRRKTKFYYTVELEIEQFFGYVSLRYGSLNYG